MLGNRSFLSYIAYLFHRNVQYEFRSPFRFEPEVSGVCFKIVIIWYKNLAHIPLQCPEIRKRHAGLALKPLVALSHHVNAAIAVFNLFKTSSTIFPLVFLQNDAIPSQSVFFVTSLLPFVAGTQLVYLWGGV